MMKIDVLTLFPQMFEEVLGEGVIGRARNRGLLKLSFINIRDFSKDKHKRVDDYPYGAGGGMVMAPEPIYNAYKSLVNEGEEKPYVVYMSPQGGTLNQAKARTLAGREHLIVLCGHYEGVDERAIELIVDEEVSIGDYVLTGGEIPAMALINAVARMVPGVIQKGNTENESFSDGLLEYPQYTRPPVFMGKEVPPILLGGHEANIKKWRRKQSIIRTAQKRPDLLNKIKFENKNDLEVLSKLEMRK